MAALISLLTIIVLSSLVIRIATVALSLTGISRDVARFQALSAFTGAGFTTDESEDIINHPARRQIVAITIRFGNIGLITTIASLMLTFINTANRTDQLWRGGILLGALLILGLLARSAWLDQWLSRLIQWFLQRWTQLDVYDYEAMLHLTDTYRVDRIMMHSNSWVADKTLAESNLRDEGVMVLGIYREDGTYHGAPDAQTSVKAGDQLIVYGREEDIDEVEARLEGSAGDSEHEQAMSEHAERQQQSAEAASS